MPAFYDQGGVLPSCPSLGSPSLLGGRLCVGKRAAEFFVHPLYSSFSAMSRASNTWTSPGSIIGKPPQPIPFSVTIPAGFVAGAQNGQVMAIDGYTARIKLSPNLPLPADSEAHLIQASIAYTQPNIGPAASRIPGYLSGNNRISIAFGGGPRTDYFLPQGLYSVNDVATQLNIIANNAGWIASPSSPLFTLQGVAATQKVILTVNPAPLTGGVFPAGGIVIDFLNPGVGGLSDSIGPVLGWPTAGGAATITAPGGSAAAISFSAPNVSDFAFTSAYGLYCSFVKDSYQSGLTGKLLAVFPLGSFAPNTVMSFQPSLKYPVPIASGMYSEVDFTLTDQNGVRLLLANFQAPTQFSILIAKSSPTAD